MYIQNWQPNQTSPVRGRARIGTTELVVACSLLAACLFGVYESVNFLAGDPATVADALQRWAEAVTD